MPSPKAEVKGQVHPRPRSESADGVTQTRSPSSQIDSGRPSPHNSHQPERADPGHGLMSLLEIEKEAREAQTLTDLHYVIANQTPKLTAARQAFVFKTVGRAKTHLVAVTGLVTVDRTVPLVHMLERLATQIARAHTDTAPQVFDVSALPDDYKGLRTTFPFHALCWLPFAFRTGDNFGGVLLAREKVWSEADVVVASRLAGAFAHAWDALEARPRSKRARLTKRPLVWFALCASLVALAIPVPMTTLAPMEIVPANPFIVAAPIDGVIEEISIDPNARVGKGDLLVAFENTTLKNQLELAQREVLVATARLKRATQLAFSDPRGRHDLGITRAELALKVAERDYAQDLLSNSQIKAEHAGIAIFSEKNELLGTPMAVGERIMQIANPAHVNVRIDIPVGDSLILKDAAPVTLYLDSNPLKPIAATIVQADYEAKKTAADTLAYTAIATIDDTDHPPPRLGVRGTAQIFGETVPLAFYLFRKPLAALRQWIGI